MLRNPPTPLSDSRVLFAHWGFELPLILLGVLTLGRKLNFIFLLIDSPPPLSPSPTALKKKKASPVSGFLPHYRNACSVKLKPMHFRLCNTFLRLMRLEWVQGSVMKTRLATFTLFPTEELPAARYGGSSHGTPGTPLFSPLDYSAPACRNQLRLNANHIWQTGIKIPGNQTLGFRRICCFVGWWNCKTPIAWTASPGAPIRFY